MNGFVRTPYCNGECVGGRGKGYNKMSRQPVHDFYIMHSNALGVYFVYKGVPSINDPRGGRALSPGLEVKLIDSTLQHKQ